MHGDVITDLGLGLFADVDLVIGCLDNREARLWVNRQCWKVGTPWIDAGIQEIQGVVKVFVPPDSACYECAMTERDYQLLNLRYSCPLLKRDEILAGKVPPRPTIASMMAALAGAGGAQAAPRHAGRGGLGPGLQRGRQPVLRDAAAVSRGLPEPRNLSRAGRAAAGPRQHRGRAVRRGPGRRSRVRSAWPWIASWSWPSTARGAAGGSEIMRPRTKVRQAEAVCPNCREPGRPEIVSAVDEGSPLVGPDAGRRGRAGLRYRPGGRRVGIGVLPSGR